MWHETEDLIEEQRRTRVRPDVNPRVPLLDALDTVPADDPQLYGSRLRAVLDAALGIAVGQRQAVLPDWFVQVSAADPGNAPAFAQAGRERFLAHPGVDRAWALEDWLSRLEPDDSIRGWAWWDLTRSGDGRLRIWINAEGEAHYSHLDLLWLAYVSGARKVAYPQGLSAADWAREESYY
jgi:hypothetical protein